MTLEEIASRYSEPALRMLNQLASDLASAGFYVSSAYEVPVFESAFVEDYEWAFVIYVKGDERTIFDEDVTVILQLKADDPEDVNGVNFCLYLRTVSEASPVYYGEICPFWGTEHEWVDPEDPESLKQRFEYVESRASDWVFRCLEEAGIFPRSRKRWRPK